VKLLPSRPAAILFAGTYALLSVAWIVLSDQGLELLFSGATVPENAQTVKGVFFVFLSTLLAYLMVRTERERALLSAADARENATRYRLALRGSRRAMWEYDPIAQQISYSAGWEQLLGYDVGGFDGTPDAWLGRTFPADAQTAARGMAELRAGTADIVEEDIRFHHASGKVGTLRVTASMYVDTDGRRRLIGAFKDVTSLRRAEEVQRERLEAQDRLARLASAMPGLLCSIRRHADGRVTMPYASDRLVHFVGMTPEVAAVDASGAFDLIDPDDVGLVQAEMARSQTTSTGFHAEYRLLTPLGLRWVEHRAMPQAQDDGGCVWHGYLQDITPRRRAAEALLSSEQRTRAHLEHVPIAVLVTDAKGRYTDANPAACTLTGWPREKLVGMRALDLVYPADRTRVASAFPDLSNADGRLEELRIVRSDRSILFVRVRAARLDNGDAISWVEDVTPERLSRAVLRTQLHLSEVAQHADLDQLLDTALADMARHTESAVAWVSRTGTSGSVHIWSHSHLALTPDRATATDIAAAAIAHGAPVLDNAARSRSLVVPVVLVGRPPLVIGLADAGTDYTASDVAFVSSIGAQILDLVDSVYAHVALRQSEDGLSRAQEIARMGSWILDLCTDDVEWSKGLRQLLGVAPETPADLALLARLVHPGDQTRLAQAWREAIDTGAAQETEVRVRVAEVDRWIRHRVELQHDEKGRVLRAIGTLQDVTERHEDHARLEAANTSLRESEAALSLHMDNLERLVEERTAALEAAEQRTRLILESTAEGIFGVDASGGVTFANRAACAMLGYTPAELVGRGVHEVFHATDHAPDACHLRALLAAGAPVRVEDDTFWGKSGVPLPVSFALQPLREDGELVGGVVNFSDVSARRAAEAALMSARDEAQRLAETRSAFLANMSHEIRTPLSPVLALAQIGLRDYANSPAGAIFDRIVDSGQLLLGVVNDILDYSKIEAGKLIVERRRFDLGKVIDRALDLTSVPSGKVLHIRVDEAADMPSHLDGDPRRLVQILVNLLSNAVKFTPSDGSILLRVQGRTDADGAHWATLSVVDTGIGMSKEQRERLFRPFEQADSTTTRRYGGTGLGLSISLFLVDQMGGHIDVTSAPGRGSTFEVCLPAPVAAPAPHGPSRTVCLLGLEEDVGALEEALRGRGARVVSLEPTDAELPDVLVISATVSTSLAVLGWARRIQGNGGQVLVLAAPGEPVSDDTSLVVIPRPIRARHVLDPPLRRRARPGVGRLNGLRVLGIEDNPANRLVLEAILSREGARLVCVDEGYAALELLTTQGPVVFDVVLTDISMPGIDGYETARRIGALAPGLPVLALTAHALPGDRERCLEAGMVGYITKPIEMDILVSALIPYLPNSVATTPSLPPLEEVPVSHEENTPGLINWAELESTMPGGATFLGRLTKVALDTQSETAARLRAAADAADTVACRRLSHDFVSTAGAFGMTSVVAAARAAEGAARDGAPEMSARTYELAALVDAMIAELKAHASRS
jgi:PAS domain S-box-containing protein